MTWKVDLSEWKMYHLIAWSKAKVELDFDTLSDLLSRCIQQWEYSSDPRVLESHKYLTISEWTTCLTMVNQEIIRIMIEAETEAKKVKTEK